jgi:hypothetical protein
MKDSSMEMFLMFLPLIIIMALVVGYVGRLTYQLIKMDLNFSDIMEEKDLD